MEVSDLAEAAQCSHWRSVKEQATSLLSRYPYLC